MGRLRFLLVAAVGAILCLTCGVGAASAATTPHQKAACDPGAFEFGSCHLKAKTHKHSISIGIGQTRPGHKRPPVGSNTPGDPPKDTDPNDPTWCSTKFGTRVKCPSAPVTPAPTPKVTLRDLKHFKPRSGIDHMQPDGWMVVGLSTNFYATVPSELERGRLLGREARVRFVPVAWHWVYGDGSQSTRATPGATWAAQGLHDFDPTATSHVFAKRGTVDIGLVVSFGAEYEYAGSGWIPIEGTIDVPANRLRATAGTAKTVLVGRDCNANPDGPGC